MNKILNKKVIVILGPTASGKTSLGVKLAHKFNGEIVSADSRQVFKGMDIGTGKDLDEFEFKSRGKKVKIPYHLIDVVSPKTEFSLVKYKKKATKAIDDILSRGKLPIVVGGSGLYLQALVDGYNLAESRPDKKLREQLEKMEVKKVFDRLEKIDAKFANKLNNSDKNNKRRLIRYIEIIKNGEKVINKEVVPYDFVLIGITWPINVLRERITKRLIERFDTQEMVGEVERLHNDGVTWKRLINFGLEYKFISCYLKKELDYDCMVEKLRIAIGQFAKRQMSWFRRWEKQGKKIHWIKNFREAEKLIK